MLFQRRLEADAEMWRSSLTKLPHNAKAEIIPPAETNQLQIPDPMRVQCWQRSLDIVGVLR